MASPCTASAIAGATRAGARPGRAPEAVLRAGLEVETVESVGTEIDGPVVVGAAALVRAHHEALDHGQAHRAQQPLGDVLVHARRAAQHAAPHIGDIGHL